MSVEIRVLRAQDSAVLKAVAADVFDHDIDPRWAGEFLDDPRHHLAVAIENALVVGMVSAVHYVHPDKPPELWINEVGVSPTHRGRGLGKQLLARILEVGRALGCQEAWVLTDEQNVPAQRLYQSLRGSAMSDLIMYSFRLTDADE